jgi:nitroimidazol reductase NimA-like FMN-containing flavoprotein (pyridoxamine 5'-phosphate oxidase superfamily)
VTALSSRTAIRRHPERGVYEREAIDAILDEVAFAHVGFVVDCQPFVIPHDQRLLKRCPAHISPLWRSAGAVDLCTP